MSAIHLAFLLKVSPKFRVICLKHAVEAGNCGPYANSTVVLHGRFPLQHAMPMRKLILWVNIRLDSHQWQHCRRVPAHQVLAEMISKLADELHKTEECICFRMHSNVCVRICCKLIIYRCIYLIHSLHILDTRIQLCINKQCSLDFLNINHACQPSTKGIMVCHSAPAQPSDQVTSLCCLDSSPSPLKKCMSGCVRITSRSICSIISASWKE